ncbi:chloride channel protein, CIC family [Sphingomonas sp. YR710]|uniref:chloride channel protein n=1 Tax=Sphingomonas sp. YR710 TaxID=1882773 RepID=UPI00088A0591|nr:chloride channel protein [Sphingomonas sp. YR710]SDC42589.1 chloride channel protein, CIC family [Sphingomonas sp. YR710]
MVERLFRPTGIVSIARRLFRASEAGFILLAIGIGVVAGLSSALLGALAHAAQGALYGLAPDMRLSGQASIAPWRLLALPLGGLLLAGMMLLAGHARRTAIDVVEANALHGGRIPLRDTLLVSVQTLLSNGCGASVGLEAAYAQAGGGIASLAGRWLNLRRNDLRILVGAGAGAAIGAAFGAPLTGAFYAFEIVIGAYTPASIAPVAAATLAAVVTARTLGATPYLIAATSSRTIATADYLLYAGFGLVAALVGIALMRLVSLVEASVRRTGWPDHVRPVIGGFLLIPIAMASPHALSAGHGALHLTIGAQIGLGALLIIFGLKIVASVISLGFGFRGGLFFASLFLGSLLGQIFAALLAMVPHAPPLPPVDAALVGMAALAVAVVGGPMTMSLLVLEATHDFAITATVLTATLCSSALVRERFGYSFSTWRLHLRGEVVRSARDVGWVRALTARRMMRVAPATAAPDLSLADFRQRFPIGSTSRVLLRDAQGHYAGLVPTAAVYADTGSAERPVAELAVLADATLSPDMDIVAIMRRFDESEADDLAVVGPDGQILGMLTEKYVRKRYGDEMDRAQRELYGED